MEGPITADHNRRKRVVRVKHRVVCGTMGAIEQVLSVCGWKINTAFVERLNLDIRQRVAALGRRVNTLCQGEDGMQHQLAVFHGYHNFVLPHMSLRQPLQVPESTNGRGSAKLWQPYTPAMAAGLTDHGWTRQEVLLFRVPPWPHPQAVEEIDYDDEHNASSDRSACDQVKGGQGGLENPFRKVTTG